MTQTMDQTVDQMSDRCIESSNHNIIAKYCKYLNKKVILKTTKSSHIGSLKCIDPLSQTIALIVNDLDTKTSKVVIAMSHSIESIEAIDDNPVMSDQNSNEFDINFNKFLSTRESSGQTLSAEELAERKQKTIELFRKNRIPCEESDNGSLCVAYALTLVPPYGRQQCVCSNEIVLHQIQSLLDTISHPISHPNQ